MPTAWAVGSTTTLYRCDGQMGFADQEITGTSSVVTHYGLGARGVDFIERVGSSTVTVFPLYDGHGNMVATLSRNGTSYSLNDQRSYGAWGEIRTGASTGDPRGRYVANLGHKQDDESGLIYMRARYYEPSRGRFISEDPARDGENWMLYCHGDPLNSIDLDGKVARRSVALLFSSLGYFLYFVGTFIAGGDQNLEAFGAAAIVGVFKWATGEAVTFFPQFFPTLHKVATAFANSMSGRIMPDGSRASRLSAYAEFWIGYGMFLAFAIDCIDMLDEFSGRWTP